MRKIIVATLMVAGVVAFSTPAAWAQNSNPCPGEKAYQVNIIGVPYGKNPPMDNNNGHRIFVPLDTSESVGGSVKIYMTGDTNSAVAGTQCGSSFYVSDANATDSNGATLVVPCNQDAPTDVCYDAWAVGLGKPGGQADVNVYCEFDGNTVLTEETADLCALDTVDFTIKRTNDGSNKPLKQNISNVFRASGCIDADPSDGLECGDGSGDVVFNNVWIFNIATLLDYYWAYDNAGLKVMQVRFCSSEDCGSYTVVE